MSAVAWVQVHVSPTEILLGFTYEDATAGPSAKGVIVQPESIAEDARRAVEAPDKTVRLSNPSVFPITPLPPETIARLGLPVHPPWLEQFYGLPPDRPWRDDPALAGRFHAEDRDDLEVTFFFQSAAERMWVRTTARAPQLGGYEGELLNTPFADGTGLAAGARVAYRVARGPIGPVWISPAVGANLERWSAECSGCGFDLLPEPAEDIIARQFQDPGTFVMGSFTTRCPVCGQGMLVQQR